MKTQDIKDYLAQTLTWGGKWKRLKKEKIGGEWCRSFENSEHAGWTITVNTGENDEQVTGLTILMLGKPLAQPQTKTNGKGYFYKLYEPSDSPDFTDIEYPVTHILTIGSKQRYMDDGPYAAQKALEPMMQQAIGKSPHYVELMEGTFELMDGEAAKLEPLLIAAGWQKGGW